MGQFSYEALNKTGEVLTGKIEAQQEITAIEQLQKKGLMVTEIKEVRTSPFLNLFKKKRQKVKIGDLALFSRQLAAMLDAGIPVTRALFTLSQQLTNPTFQEVITDVAQSVESGTGFTDALNNHPHIFSTLYIGMVRSGEVGGSLEETLERLSEQLQKEKTLNDNIRSATFYPAVVAGFAVFLLLAMMFFLVPIFMGFFPADVELPLATRVIIVASDLLRSFWYIFFMSIALLVFGIRYYLKSTRGMQQWDKLRFRLPVFGQLIHRVIIARFTRTLSTLLNGGISVVQGMEIAGPASGSYQIETAVNVACQRIQEGRSIAAPLEESGLFPPMVTHMISVGEETGDLPNLLTRISEFYEEEVATLTKGLTSMIEPIMLIIVGIIVGIMLIALYLPIFTVITEVA